MSFFKGEPKHKHHKHYDGVVEVPIERCLEGGTKSKEKTHCCLCDWVFLQNPRDYSDAWG